MKIEVYHVEMLVGSDHPDDPETLDELVFYLVDFDMWIRDEGYKVEDIKEISWTEDFWTVVDRCGDHVTYLGEL